jgi:hypothetical protein
MFIARSFLIVAAAAALGGAASSCTGLTQGSASGQIEPADAAKTVVLHVQNRNIAPMELRTILNGRSEFVGSVAGNDSTDILLDPVNFPTGFLYIAAIPSGGGGRALVGPLGASKGERITFTIEPALDQSHARVSRDASRTP